MVPVYIHFTITIYIHQLSIPPIYYYHYHLILILSLHNSLLIYCSIISTDSLFFMPRLHASHNKVVIIIYSSALSLPPLTWCFLSLPSLYLPSLLSLSPANQYLGLITVAWHFNSYSILSIASYYIWMLWLFFLPFPCCIISFIYIYIFFLEFMYVCLKVIFLSIVLYCLVICVLYMRS